MKRSLIAKTFSKELPRFTTKCEADFIKIIDSREIWTEGLMMVAPRGQYHNRDPKKDFLQAIERLDDHRYNEVLFQIANNAPRESLFWREDGHLAGGHITINYFGIMPKKNG